VLIPTTRAHCLAPIILINIIDPVSDPLLWLWGSKPSSTNFYYVADGVGWICMPATAVPAPSFISWRQLSPPSSPRVASISSYSPPSPAILDRIVCPRLPNIWVEVCLSCAAFFLDPSCRWPASIHRIARLLLLMASLLDISGPQIKSRRAAS